MKSIRENTLPSRLPDFRNLGVMLRILLGVNSLMALAALMRNRDFSHLAWEMAELAAYVEPVTLGSLVALGFLARPLTRLPYRLGVAVVLVIVMMLAGPVFLVLDAVFNLWQESVGLWRPLFWAALVTVLLLGYFSARDRLHAPSLVEARLMALTARIRPHFLFNSLNAVLGVIRSDPRRAETALEELADLFRALMRDNRTLVPLSEEIALARQYLGLERLRLGERLGVKWDVEACPPEALVPPLLLQPLLENAVYHGIETSQNPGEIEIRFTRDGERILISLGNPVAPGAEHVHGNQMALENIRERLMLFYDLEARLDTRQQAGRFQVLIELPYRKDGLPSSCRSG